MVRLYEHDGFLGREYDVQGAASDRCLFGTEFNDMISSIRIRSGTGAETGAGK